MKKPIIRVLCVDSANGDYYYKVVNNMNDKISRIESVNDTDLRKKFRKVIKEQIASFIESYQIDFKIQYSDKYESVGNAAGEIICDLIRPVSVDHISQFHYALRNPSLD